VTVTRELESLNRRRTLKLLRSMLSYNLLVSHDQPLLGFLSPSSISMWQPVLSPMGTQPIAAGVECREESR
jgi:hypothetical protein